VEIDSEEHMKTKVRHRRSCDSWFDADHVAAALRRQRFNSRNAKRLFDVMVDVTYARTGEALLSLRHWAPLTAERVEELVPGDDVDLDQAVRTYADYVARIVFPYTGRSIERHRIEC
jgi:hypothetical protein